MLKKSCPLTQITMIRITTLVIATLLGRFLGQAHAVGLAERPLKIASWNIQVFGSSKISNTDVIGTIIEILRRYDLIAIQEIRDSTGKAFETLVKKLNRIENSDPYVYEISERLGNSVSKEQYAFLYRKSLFTAVDAYQYPARYNKFERPPYTVRFKSPKTELSEFAIINIHTSPDKANEEVNYLKHIYNLVSKKWNLKEILIVGDFNADCRYVTSKEMKKLYLRKDEEFKWLIDDLQDTTVKSTDCAYDRIVTKSSKFLNAIVPDSVGVFYFDKRYRLDQDTADDVSDHYPIEFELKGKIDNEIQRDFRSSVGFTIYDDGVGCERSVENLEKTMKDAEESLRLTGFDVQVTPAVKFNVLKIPSKNVTDDLRTIQKQIPQFLSHVTIALAEAHLTLAIFQQTPYVPGLADVRTSDSYELSYACALRCPAACYTTVTRYLK